MASPKTTITLTHSHETYGTILAKMLHSSTVPRREMVSLRNLFHAAAGGDRDLSAIVSVNSGEEVLASSTVTVLSAAIGDTAVVGGITLTAVDHKERTNITYADDSAGSLNSTYYTFQDQTGAYKYYVWFSINNLGVDPALAGRVGIKVIGATGVLKATSATATTVACAGTTASKATFNADSSGSLNNTYFTFRDQLGRNKYYFWFNINSAGTDPALAGYTGIQVAGATGATAATLATAAFTAANTAKVSGISIVNSASGVLLFSAYDGFGAILKDGPSVATSTQFVMVQCLRGVTALDGASTHVVVRNTGTGAATATADGTAATSFTFTHDITGSTVANTAYDIGSTDTLAAANLAAAINANTSLKQVATATSSAAVVTVSSFYPGPIGNLITLTATTGNTAGAATLANGALATTTSAFTTYHVGT